MVLELVELSREKTPEFATCFVEHIIVENDEPINEVYLSIGGQEIARLEDINSGMTNLKFFETESGSLHIPAFTLKYHEITVGCHCKGRAKFYFVWKLVDVEKEIGEWENANIGVKITKQLNVPMGMIQTHPNLVGKGFNNIIRYTQGMAGKMWSY